MIGASPLVSLWEMLRTYAAFFYNISGHLDRLATSLDTFAGIAPPDTELDDRWKQIIREKLGDCEVAVRVLELRSVASQIARINRILESGCTLRMIQGTVADLSHRFNDELSARRFLYVAESVACYYERPLEGWGDVSTRFPAAIVDIEEGGKCLALSRGTACVFHLMRVLEVALQRLAVDLDVPQAQAQKNWQVVLDLINKAVRALPHSTPQEKEYLAQRATAAAHLHNVKEAWRNDVMHPRASYTEEQALDIWNHTKTLTATLAGFL